MKIYRTYFFIAVTEKFDFLELLYLLVEIISTWQLQSSTRSWEKGRWVWQADTDTEKGKKKQTLVQLY